MCRIENQKAMKCVPFAVNVYIYIREIPTRNGAPETCKSQACFSTFHALHLALFHAWI